MERWGGGGARGPAERKKGREEGEGVCQMKRLRRGWGVLVKTDLPRANEEKAGVGRMGGLPNEEGGEGEGMCKGALPMT